MTGAADVMRIELSSATVLGGSMGAAIALLASARLQNADLRFSVLGACLSGSLLTLQASEGRALAGHVL